MALNGIGSYLSTMSEFSAHWASVNVQLGGTPATELKLQGGFTRAMFETLRTDLGAAITGLENLENAREIAAADRDQKKAAISQRMSQFRGMLRALLPNTVYESAAPVLPPIGSAESKFLAPFDDMASLWSRINADATIPGFTPPLLIAGFTQAQFVTELAALRTVYGNVTIAENDLDISRRRRDALLPAARERMVQYRELVPAMFGPDHPMSLSLPDLSAAPGSTPDPVTLSGLFNQGIDMAVLNWTESTNPGLQSYQVRQSAGATYDGASSSIVTNAPPGVLNHMTSDGLSNPGDVATFKVFVLLSTGNQAGSNPITLARPLPPTPPMSPPPMP